MWSEPFFGMPRVVATRMLLLAEGTFRDSDLLRSAIHDHRSAHPAVSDRGDGPLDEGQDRNAS